MLRWPAGDRKTIYLSIVVLGSCAFITMVYGLRLWGEYKGGAPEFGDFRALWSYGAIAGSHRASDLYTAGALEALQAGLGMREGEQNPFPYPPVAILLFRPLAWLPYGSAYLVWTLGTLGLFVWAVVATCSRLAITVVGVVVAPVSTSCIASGQTGFLTAALLVAGVRLAERRPVLGGVLIGLLAYKPQMAMLVPIAFAAAGYWRAVAAAGVTVVVLAGVATAAYGTGVWADWVAMLPGYLDAFDRDPSRMNFKPTVMANLQLLGVGLQAAKAIQGLVAVVVACLVWRCFRRLAGRLAVAALLVGTVLATPHALIYDLPIVVAAMALVIQERVVFSLGDIVILVLAFTFPVLMMVRMAALPVSAVPLLLLFGLILRDHGSTLRHHSQLKTPI